VGRSVLGDQGTLDISSAQYSDVFFTLYRYRL